MEKVAGKNFRLRFGYMAMNDVMKVLKDMDLPQKDQDFGEMCALSVRVRLSEVDAFLEKLSTVAEISEI